MSTEDNFKIILEKSNAENKAVLNQLLGEIRTERAHLRADTEGTIKKIIQGIGITIALTGGVISISAFVLKIIG